MKKAVFAGLIVALISGCVSMPTPPPSPQQVAASVEAFNQTHWGYLQQYIGRQYANEDGDWLRITAEPTKAELLITVYHINTKSPAQQYATERLIHVRPADTEDTFHFLLEAPTLFPDDKATIRFDEGGRMQVLTGSLRNMQLTLTDTEVHFSYPEQPWSYAVTPKPMKRDLYTLPDNRTVPVDLEPGSPYQKLRASGPFGIWERSVGQTFVSGGTLLKLEKDETGNLVFIYSEPDETASYALTPGRLVFRPSSTSDPKALQVQSMPNWKDGWFVSKHLSLSADDRLTHAYRGVENFIDNGAYQDTYINRGNSIRIVTFKQDPGVDQPSLSNNLYLPVTRERLAAAIEYREKQVVERERSRLYAEREAARRAARSEATANAVLQGLATGFSEAQQTNNRLNQQSSEFERDLNEKLRQIDRQNRQRERDSAARADQIIAANNAAARAHNTPTPSQQLTQSQSALTSSNTQDAQRKEAEQRQADQAKAAEQARIAKEKQRAEDKLKSEEDARQKKAQQEKALKDHLAAERRGIRLRAETCPGGNGFPSMMGSRPKVNPKVANCIFVHFEARCPGERPGTGVTGSIERFLGHDSCFDNSYPLPRKLSCDVKQAVVEVTDVTTCP